MLVAHASGLNISSQDVKRLDPAQFQPELTTRVTNALWFPSLVLALLVSMLSILAKQWIVMFSSRMRSPVSHMRSWVHRHRFFRDGIDRWHLDAFVSSLSVALHLAVVLFLVGLNVRLYGLDLYSFIPVLVLTGLMLTFYIAATIAPLFYDDCPTLTPLLFYGRRITRALFRRNPSATMRASRQAAFDEAVMLRGPEEARDVSALAWMIKHLPAGHDIDAALDAIGPLKIGRNSPLWVNGSRSQVAATTEHLRTHARSRLNDILIQSTDVVEDDPAALARALRASLSLEDTDLTPRASPYPELMANLTRSLAHDILPLGLALDFKMSAMDPNARSEMLRTQIESICSLLLSRSYSKDSGHPTTSLTRHIVFNTIDKVSRSRRGLLRAHECTQMVLAFGPDLATRRDVCELTTNALLDMISPFSSQLLWRSFSPEMTWRVQAVQTWSFAATQYNAIQQITGEPLPPVLSIWKCFAAVFDDWSESKEDKILAPGQTWYYLLPLSFPPEEVHLIFSLQAARVALSLVSRAVTAASSGAEGSGFKWTAITANIIFTLLNVILSTRERMKQAEESGFHVAVILHKLVQSSPGHAMVLASLNSSASPQDIWDDNPLSNLLADRNNVYTGGPTTSLWYLMLDCLIVGDEERHRIDLAALIAADLAILAQVPELGINAALGWAELMSHGFGERFLHSPYARRSAMLAISRHGRVIDPEWWMHAKVALVPSGSYQSSVRTPDWYPTAHGFETPAAYIEAVENEGPCASCDKAVAEVRHIMQDPNFQQKFPSRRLVGNDASSSWTSRQPATTETAPPPQARYRTPQTPAPRVHFGDAFSASDLAAGPHQEWNDTPHSSEERLLATESSAAPPYPEDLAWGASGRSEQGGVGTTNRAV